MFCIDFALNLRKSKSQVLWMKIVLIRPNAPQLDKGNPHESAVRKADGLSPE